MVIPFYLLLFVVIPIPIPNEPSFQFTKPSLNVHLADNKKIDHIFFFGQMYKRRKLFVMKREGLLYLVMRIKKRNKRK